MLFYIGFALTIHVIETFRSDDDEPNISDIEYLLRNLLLNGYGGECLLVRHTRTGRFVRFEKQGDGGVGGGIALTFPEIRWGGRHLPRLRAYCDNHDLPIRPSSDHEVRRAGSTQVDFGSDIAAAVALAKTIWTEFYRYDLGEPQTCTSGDCSTMAELTLPPAAEVSPKRQKERIARYWRAHARHSGLGWLGLNGFRAVFAFVGLGCVVAPFALPIATLLSIGEPPDWQVALGSVEAQGSAASLAFFILYIVSFAGLRRFQWRRPIIPHRLSRISRLVMAPIRTLCFAMPSAVILVWLGN